jgi:agmatinase
MAPTADLWPARNFGALPAALAARARAAAIILPVPYDATTSARAGAREGPMAIIDASQEMELYDAELDREVAEVGIHTLPELAPDARGPEATLRRVERVARRLLRTGKLLVTLGGEHSITIGAVRAVRAEHPGVGVLQLDAHADLRDRYMGSPYSHACVGRRLAEGGPLVQVGIRSLSAEEAAYLQAGPCRLFWARDIVGRTDWIPEVVATLPDEVYITIDLDVFDAGLMPAVGTPEPGGLGWYEVLALLRAVAHSRRVVAADVVELAPREGPAACSHLAALLVYKLIGYVTCQPGFAAGR